MDSKYNKDNIYLHKQTKNVKRKHLRKRHFNMNIFIIAIQLFVVICIGHSSCRAQFNYQSDQSDGYGYGNEKQRPNLDQYPNYSNRVQAAVHSKHSIRYVNVDIPNEEREPQIIEVDANPIPIIMHFKSASSRIRVKQSHSNSGSNHVQETKSEDDATRLIHTVTKPVIQEVREIVTPYRRIIQEIQPVREEVQTIVAKKSDRTEHGYEERPSYGKEETGGLVGSVLFKNSNNGLVGSVVGTGIKNDNIKRSTSNYAYNNINNNNNAHY